LTLHEVEAGMSRWARWLLVVALAAVYLLVLTPLALLWRLRPAPRRDTCWQPRPQTEDMAAYLRTS
jgi:hypothetical protein